MQDSINYPALNCHFICDFALKCDFLAISERKLSGTSLHIVAGQCYVGYICYPPVDYRILMHSFITLSDDDPDNSH